jgi:hypothetical protein
MRPIGDHEIELGKLKEPITGIAGCCARAASGQAAAAPPANVMKSRSLIFALSCFA